MTELESAQASIVNEGRDTDEGNKTHTRFQSIVPPITGQTGKETAPIPWRELAVTTETKRPHGTSL